MVVLDGAHALLELLREYGVSHVFGLPGETTLPLYNAWFDFRDVAHVRVRDERNAVIAADGYARASFKPGIVEAPGVGATYLLPGIAEAFRSRVPLIIIVSDVAISDEGRNVLTEYRKDLMFRDLTKDVIVVYEARELPRLIRRAFRLATAGIPGPVYVRIPYNVWGGDVDTREVYAQREFSRYPAIRFRPGDELIMEAIKLLLRAERPVIVCGQGVLLSQAWDELYQLATRLAIPVGSTITGKGCFPETHPLSIGVVGKRGGTRLSNSVVNEADLVFFIGTNTDSTGTADWTVPSIDSNKAVIHLDINEAELGNNYRTVVNLLGDAKETLAAMLRLLGDVRVDRSKYIDELVRRRAEWEDYVKSLIDDRARPIQPLYFIRVLEDLTRDGEFIITADPGIGAIYSSAYYRTSKAGRTFMYNYSLGGLGFALPMGLGAHLATGKTVIVLTTDGNLGFNMGELETVRSLDARLKIVVFNNKSFGWIRATILSKYGKKFFHTDFGDVDFVKVAEAHGIRANRLEKPSEVRDLLTEMLRNDEPHLLEVPALPEDMLMPPVPEWRETAQKHDIPYLG